MKKILALAFVAMMSIGAMAQTAQQVLDKTAAVIGNKGGASANFNMSSSKSVSYTHLTLPTICISKRQYCHQRQQV